MKNIRIILIILTLNGFGSSSYSTTYYFSSNLGNDSFSFTQAQNKNTPWKSLSKLETLYLFLQPGDSVLFKKGDTFVGSINIKTSGTKEKPIVFASYGTGTNPVLTSLTSLSNWSLLKDNIYYTTMEVPSLNLVLINNQIQKIGRYPNTGYLYYQNHNTNISVTDKNLKESNWIGAELVIRKNRWILDRHTVVNQTANTLFYDTLAHYGNNNLYIPKIGNGYFIQGHLSTLDQHGEWYYNDTEKRLYIYLEKSHSDELEIKVSTRETNFTIISQEGILFKNIDFEGGNINGGKIVDSSHIGFKDCNFYNQGGNALYGIKVSNLSVNGGTIRDALNNGIWVEDDGSFITINGVNTLNIGIIAGAGRSGDGTYEAIAISGTNTTIKNCSVNNTGYNGITFYGLDALVENNYIKDFCLIKDDGGGIYTYRSNRGIVKNNIIINAQGAYEGAEWAYWEPFGKAAGIYLDDGIDNHNATIQGNTIAHGEWGGIFINNNGGNTITDNLVYDFAVQMFITSYEKEKIKNMIIKNNQFIAKTTKQTAFYIHMFSEETISLFGHFDFNYYTRPIDDNLTIKISQDGKIVNEISLTEWKKISSMDRNSKKSSLEFTDINSFRLEYNASPNNKIVDLKSQYIDITGNNYDGTIIIPSYSSKVLLKK